MKKLFSLVMVSILGNWASGSLRTPAALKTAAPSAAGKLKVFGAHATPIVGTLGMALSMLLCRSCGCR